MEHTFEAIIRRLLSGEITQKEALTGLFEFHQNSQDYFHGEIATLRQQLAKPAIEWISVKDRLPEFRVPVLIRVTCSDYFNIEEGVLLEGGDWINFWLSTRRDGIYPVTHWQPLPNPPAAYDALQD